MGVSRNEKHMIVVMVCGVLYGVCMLAAIYLLFHTGPAK